MTGHDSERSVKPSSNVWVCSRDRSARSVKPSSNVWVYSRRRSARLQSNTFGNP